MLFQVMFMGYIMYMMFYVDLVGEVFKWFMIVFINVLKMMFIVFDFVFIQILMWVGGNKVCWNKLFIEINYYDFENDEINV